MFKKVTALVAGLALLSTMGTSALALDVKVDYKHEGSDFSARYVVRNATKKLDKSTTGPDGSVFDMWYEGDLQTTVDVSGMDSVGFKVLEEGRKGGVTAHVLGEEKITPGQEMIVPGSAIQEKRREYFDLSGLGSKGVVGFEKPGTYVLWATKGQAAWAPEGFTQFIHPVEQYAIILTITGEVPPTTLVAPTWSKVLIDGKQVSFEAYNHADTNYFKLRDVAAAISGSAKQFDVIWDEARSAIQLVSGRAYTLVGGEFSQGNGWLKEATHSMVKIFKDEAELALFAYTVKDNNYFKLRDLGQAFDFDVSWDAANNAVVINTKAAYTAD